MEEQISDIAKYFDHDVMDGPFLRWLSSWLGISQQLHWSDDKLRAFMKEAPDIYKVRGTRQALEKMLTIYTGEPPLIIEFFQLKQMREQSELRVLMDRLFDSNPYSFCVLMKPETVRTEQQQFLVRKIIEQQKPAFSEVKIVLLQPWMYMDMHTYLGVNTVLSEPTLMHIDETSSMPHNTIIIDVDQENRVGLHTRLGLDSELD